MRYDLRYVLVVTNCTLIEVGKDIMSEYAWMTQVCIVVYTKCQRPGLNELLIKTFEKENHCLEINYH